MIARLRPRLGMEEFIEAWKQSDDQEDVKLFEHDFAALMDVKHAVAFPYGRTGLIMLLKAFGLENKEVICPAYTCVVVPHAIVYSGNKPVFIDSQEYDFNMNLELAEKAINENTGAIIATSIFGYPVNLEQLRSIKEKYPHVRIIQDCAHSFAAEWRGLPVHKAGDAAIFGLNISKLMHSIFGGMVVTNDDVIAEKLRAIRHETVKQPNVKKRWQRRLYLMAVYPTFTPVVYSMINYLERSKMLDRFTKYYADDIIDMPSDYLSGMTGVEAKVGRVQVCRYKQIIRDRINIANYYYSQLSGIAEFNRPPIVDGATYSHYVGRVQNRDELIEFALQRGVQLGNLIEYCIPQMRAYREMPGSQGLYPVASKMAKESINLPLWVNEEQAAACVNVLGKYFSRSAKWKK